MSLVLPNLLLKQVFYVGHGLTRLHVLVKVVQDIALVLYPGMAVVVLATEGNISVGLQASCFKLAVESWVLLCLIIIESRDSHRLLRHDLVCCNRERPPLSKAKI